MRTATGRDHRRGMTIRAAFAGLAVVCAASLASPATADVPPIKSLAAVVPIEGEINDIVRDSVSRRLDEARKLGAGTVIFEMNTPGGAVSSALEICRLIKGLPDEVRTVAWVKPEAYSAGAMISVACDRIYMSDHGVIGDCAPIMLTPEGVSAPEGTVRAKVESPILQEFRDSAQRNGYDPLLCRAMVVTEVEVWWIENAELGTRRFVTTDEKKKLVDDAGEKPAWKLVESFNDPSGVKIAVDQPVDRSDSLLTVSAVEAFGLGLSKGTASSLDQLTSALELPSTPRRLDISIWDMLALWLNSPIVRGILFVLVIVGGYVEFQHPGLILPGAVAVIALAIFLGAPYAAGLADIWTFLLLFAGLVLLGIELFVIPGFGIAGLAGILCILVSVVGTFVPAEPGAPWFSFPTLPGTWESLKTGILVVSGSIITGLIGIFLVLRYLPQLPVGRQLMLATPDARNMALADPYPDVALVGDVGVVINDIRPGGQVRFGAEVVEVQSQGEYIVAGQRVQVLKREGPSIVVRPVNVEA